MENYQIFVSKLLHDCIHFNCLWRNIDITMPDYQFGLVRNDFVIFSFKETWLMHKTNSSFLNNHNRNMKIILGYDQYTYL